MASLRCLLDRDGSLACERTAVPGVNVIETARRRRDGRMNSSVPIRLRRIDGRSLAAGRFTKGWLGVQPPWKRTAAIEPATENRDPESRLAVERRTDNAHNRRNASRPRLGEPPPDPRGFIAWRSVPESANRNGTPRASRLRS
jgi:hypothetical protein